MTVFESGINGEGRCIMEPYYIYNLDEYLSNVIYKALVKFHHEVKINKYTSVPIISDGGMMSVEESRYAWLGAVSKMIYAFDESEIPDIENYDGGLGKFEMDMDAYVKKCEEGRLLFAKHLHDLNI